MKKRRKKRNKKVKIGIFAVLAVVILLTMLIIGGFKLYESFERQLEEDNHPLKYTDIVEKYSDAYNVPQELIYATIKAESNFDPKAESSAGACGLMQLLPTTFEELVHETNGSETAEDIFDPEVNIKYGTYYMAKLYKRFGDWDTVHAAYNAGQTRVAQWLADPEYSKDGKLTNIPYPETENYITKIKQYKEKYIQLYGIGENGNE